MQEPYIAVRLGQTLPEPIKSVTRPLYRWGAYLQKSILGRGTYAYEYDGAEVTMYPTRETVWTLDRLIDDRGRVSTENIPVELFDVDADHVIDVGAHYGIYTLLLASLNPEASVTAFEPDDYNREVCRKLLAKNGAEAEIRSEVVADRTGMVDFFLHSDEGSESNSLSEIDDARPVKKRAVALSDILDGDERVWIKIDAEGGEWQIIKDLMSAAPDVEIAGIVELHPDKLPVSAESVLARLRERFTVEFVAETSDRHPRADEIDHEYNRPMYKFYE